MPRTRPQIRPRPAYGEEATASRLELFFDLAYVLVVLELANAFYADLSWRGFAVFVALYVALWFFWVGFTLYANRFDTDDVVFRLAKLAATAYDRGLAPPARRRRRGEFSTPFALCFLAGAPDPPAAAPARRGGTCRRPGRRSGVSGLHRGEHGACGPCRPPSTGPCGTACGRRGRDGRPRPVVATRREDRAPHAHGAPARAVRALHHPRARRGGRRRGTGVHDAKWTGRPSPWGSPGSSSPRRCGGTTSTSPPATARRRLQESDDDDGAEGAVARRAARPVRPTATPAVGGIVDGRGRDRGPGGAPVRRPAVDGGWTVAAGLACTCSGRR
jgi:hypothetical protein